MVIKVAILDEDAGYLNKLRKAFDSRYNDKLECYSFTDAEMAFAAVRSKKISVLLIDEKIDAEVTALPRWCSCAYLVDNQELRTKNGKHAFCKFQKADVLYKEILNVFAENADALAGFSHSVGSAKVVAFTSPCGGCGTSSIAAAYAVRLAEQQKKVCYLNLETFSSAQAFFNAAGIATMSDVIYAVKNKRTNLTVKLESAVREAACGVKYYAGASVPMHMLEFTADERIQLLETLKTSGGYDYIVVDVPFSIQPDGLKVLRMMNAVVFVSTGTEIANQKVYSALNAVTMLEQGQDISLLHRASILYNQFSKSNCKVLSDCDIRNLGGIPRLDHAASDKVVEYLASQEVLDGIL